MSFGENPCKRAACWQTEAELCAYDHRMNYCTLLEDALAFAVCPIKLRYISEKLNNSWSIISYSYQLSLWLALWIYSISQRMIYACSFKELFSYQNKVASIMTYNTFFRKLSIALHLDTAWIVRGSCKEVNCARSVIALKVHTWIPMKIHPCASLHVCHTSSSSLLTLCFHLQCFAFCNIV